MTTDEVILRRERAAANGEPFKEPPPRLRGQSTYLALLSSLATDLDIMLNDLRASPSSRLLASSSSSGGGGNGGTTTASQPTATSAAGTSPLLPARHHIHNSSASGTSSTGYLQSCVLRRSHYENQQQQQSVHLINVPAEMPQNFNSRQQSSYRNSGGGKRYSSSSQEQQTKQYRNNVNSSCTRRPTKSSNGTSPSTTTTNDVMYQQQQSQQQMTCGLSPDVKSIQKLPLWSSSSIYQQQQQQQSPPPQHKPLQKPQKLHIQLLQQQQATKAIAAQLQQQQQQQNASNNESSNNSQGLSSSGVYKAASNTTTTTSMESSIKATTSTTTTSSKSNSRIAAITKNLFECNNCNVQSIDQWLKASYEYANEDYKWSSQDSNNSNTQISTQQNQLKSCSIGSNGNNSNNLATKNNTTTNNHSNSVGSCNNNNNNNNINRRLPFCGLDSIKGSDNNGKKDGGNSSNSCNNVEAHLNFDLNLKKCAAAGNGGGNNNCRISTASSGGIDNIAATTEQQFHSLDANESSCCGDDGHFEDDMQALLPKCKRFSRDELSQSRTSLVSSSDGGILAAGETSSETSCGTDNDESPPCDLGLVERLLLTHPVWFLPGIQRSGAVHFLQGKEEGNFIVRGSSQPNTMAVSVRLPPDTGPYIEHYLIQSNEGILCLESSRFKFDSIPALIAHYAQCCDELPVQLVLPHALRDAKNRQQLSSLALLGQEFWRYPMSCAKPAQETEAQFLDAKSPNSFTETSGIGATVSSNSAGSNNTAAQQNSQVFSPTTGQNFNGLFSEAGTPSDTTSSMSSFTTSGGQHMQVMSPESVDSVILTMSPCDINNQRNGMLSPNDFANGPQAALSTFKSNGLAQLPYRNGKPPQNTANMDMGVRVQRPKPPNTLNLDLRKPPAPPMRWSKPHSPNTPSSVEQNGFTVTTTVTFSVDNNNKNSSQFVEVTTPSTNNGLNAAPNSNATFQTFSKRLSPEGECKDTLSSQGSTGSRWQSQSSKDSHNSQRKILSPSSVGTPSSAMPSGGKSRKAKARKESKHYQESDILDSPQIYCRSALGDKISDYEDLWTQDPSDRTGLLTSFKPHDGVQGKRPDLLAETPTATNQPASILSPTTNITTAANTPTAALTKNDTQPKLTADTTPAITDNQHLIQFSADIQPRSRAGLILPGLMSQSLAEDQFKTEATEDDVTPTSQTPQSQSRSKQGSPFYAEPADALRQAGLSTASILRRSQRGPLLPANHRHSEPPKSGLARTPLCPLLMPTEIEKMAGSLDELKKKQQQQPNKRARGRFEQWQLDSSWEFMAKQNGDNDDDNERDEDNEKHGHDNFGLYDTEEHWKQQKTSHDEKENSLGREHSNKVKAKPLTVHQIIAKRLPDLNLPELIRCSTPQQQNGIRQHSELNGSQKSVDSHTSCRLSSYDNVERNYGYCQNFLLDSAQSDDGTVFSEPWDSSQWDTMMPNDDATINSDTIHFSKCRPVVSEDDTIIEELSTKDHNQDTLKARKYNDGKPKVATILRNPSIRDREILCHPRNKLNLAGTGPGDSLRIYTLQLAADPSSTFARNIENFISCTKESREAAPQVVMRNMRQFMNGMKNYLVKHGEGKFHQEVEASRSRLKSDEFLNLDAILETVMHQLVVLPLREHLYGMFVDYYTRSEDIQLLAQNVKYACGRSASDFGIRNTVTPPSAKSLVMISNLLLRLQEAELPLDKLELFLCVITTIFEATGCPRGQQLGADDFLPVLVFVVAKCGFVGAEIEAEFMWGLLQPQLLNGEPGYYLTALCSAVHVLKSFMASENESGTLSLDWRSSSLPACSSVLRVIIPDECNGSLQTRTLPVRPHTTTREVCRIIAHKARITNPQDYALFKLVDGEETLLSDQECPQDIRLAAKGKHCMLAYKRIDAKIAWPTTTTTTTSAALTTGTHAT